MPLLPFVGVTLFLVVTALLPLWRHPAWWVRGAEFPRLQLAVIALAAVALTLLLTDRGGVALGLVAVQGACLAYQLFWIVPYSRLYPREVKTATHEDPARRLRILTANVLATNRNVDGFLALVAEHEPDVVVTLETNAWWQARLAPLETEFTHTMQCALENLYGMNVYSRLPLSECATEFLVEPDVPSMHALVTLRSGDQVRAHFLHPAPPSPTENDASLERDAELLIVGRSVADAEGPVVVTGDLNDVAWSATTRLFRKVSALLDPRVGRGMYNTFHARFWFMRWPLDHLFHSRHFTLRSITRLPGFGSDHFALLTELALQPDRGAGQDGLHADRDDQRWAEDVMRKEGVTSDDVPSPGQ